MSSKTSRRISITHPLTLINCARHDGERRDRPPCARWRIRPVRREKLIPADAIHPASSRESSTGAAMPSFGSPSSASQQVVDRVRRQDDIAVDEQHLLGAGGERGT